MVPKRRKPCVTMVGGKPCGKPVFSYGLCRGHYLAWTSLLRRTSPYNLSQQRRNGDA